MFPGSSPIGHQKIVSSKRIVRARRHTAFRPVTKLEITRTLLADPFPNVLIGHIEAPFVRAIIGLINLEELVLRGFPPVYLCIYGIAPNYVYFVWVLIRLIAWSR